MNLLFGLPHSHCPGNANLSILVTRIFGLNTDQMQDSGLDPEQIQLTRFRAGDFPSLNILILFPGGLFVQCRKNKLHPLSVF